MQQIEDNKVRLDDDEVTALAVAVDIALRTDRAFAAYGVSGALTAQDRLILSGFRQNLALVERITVKTSTPVDISMLV